MPPQVRTTYVPEDINTWLIHSPAITACNWIDESHGSKRIHKVIAYYKNDTLLLASNHFEHMVTHSLLESLNYKLQLDSW